MEEPPDSHPPSLMRHFRNWLSLAGIIIVAGSFFAFLLLFAFDLTTSGGNPYVGILSYIVAPFFFLLGLFLILAGWVWHYKKGGKGKASLRFDLGKARDRQIFVAFVVGAICFMFVSALGSYETYSYTSSNEFCGTLCHTVMAPQFAAYAEDTHSKIACVQCHVGEGAGGAVKAKWHGIYKVYSLAFHKYPQPLRADPHYLPTAEETCLKCHENQNSFTDVAKIYHHFLSDDENTPFSVALRLKLSPDATEAADTRGIHWHARNETRVEFATLAENPNIVPWIRVSDETGVTREYRFQPDEDDELDGPLDLSATHPAETMDCMDCHSRPAHSFPKPNDLIEAAIRKGDLDPSLPELKYVIAGAFSQQFSNQREAFIGLEDRIGHSFRNVDPTLMAATIETAKSLFAKSIFPEMKSDWRAYPDFIGHKDALGCFRCHDDKHTTLDGSRTLSAQNCNTCHDVIAQGVPGQMEFATAADTEFDHPDGSYLGFTCAECHTGGLQLE